VPLHWSWCLFFFLLPSFYHFDFDLGPWCHVLVSLPFICYLTNKHLVQRKFQFTSQGTCFFNFISSGHVLGLSPHHMLFNNKDLGHRRFHFTGHGACFFFFFPLFTFLIFIRFLGVLFWFLSPSFVISQTRTWDTGGCILLVNVLDFFILYLMSCFGFSPLHLLFKKQGLGA
jgi:hypothetical protein